MQVNSAPPGPGVVAPSGSHSRSGPNGSFGPFGSSARFGLGRNADTIRFGTDTVPPARTPARTPPERPANPADVVASPAPPNTCPSRDPLEPTLGLAASDPERSDPCRLDLVCQESTPDRHQQVLERLHAVLVRLTLENRTHGRRPPLPGATRGRNATRVQPARDLPQAPARPVLKADAFRELSWDRSRAADRRRPRLPWLWPAPPVEQPLELVDRDQPRARWHLDRLDVRKDTAIESGAADPERGGRLGTGVSEPLDPFRLAYDLPRRSEPARCNLPLCPCALAPSTTA
jgi:hypothetical protein